MTKKTAGSVSMMAPLFPQYDEEEEARRLSELAKTSKTKGPKKSSKVSTARNGKAMDSKSKSRHGKKNIESLANAVVENKVLEKEMREQKGKVVAQKNKDIGLDSLEKKAPINNTEYEGQKKNKSFYDIPDDALPPPRPELFLQIRPSSALHSKLMAQAKDEGLTVEALALEMLAESVVLRAWEILERKGAMRASHGFQGGPAPAGFNQNPSRHQSHRPNRSFEKPPQRHGGAYQEPNYNSHHYQGETQGQSYQNSRGGGYRARGPQSWKEDQGSFLEYVRSQERRGGRT